jgi:UDP-N-acetylmuramoyl-L-alanyl-D-glutamate--2,6-diaminopimelate ligase
MTVAATNGRTAMQSRIEGVRKMNLRQLIAGITAVVPPDVEITDLTLDSRAIRPGMAFIALPGTRTHGVGFAAQAVTAGARAVVWEPVAGVAAPVLAQDVPLIAVPDLTQILGSIADRFFAAPSRAVRIVGVTGTNGKTTTAHVIAAALHQLGEASAYAGTLGYGRIEALHTGTHTTPDSITVHRQLAELRDEGVRFLGMEVSSHALDQHRVDAVRFDTAVFTNLTRDHLDYHCTLDAYGAAKAKLFAWPELQHAVINADDPFGRTLLASSSLPPDVISFSRAADATLPGRRHLRALHVVANPHGLEIAIDSSWGATTLRSRLIGAFNVENLLGALATLLSWGVPLPRAIQALEQCSAPPGRMETLSIPGKPLAIVDYAHTPDALEKALHAVRAHCQGKVTCVFGCGGDRDPGKRPLMGAIAERLADRVLITDDNPRSEDGDAIVAGIASGLARPWNALIERDRERAIARALAEAGPADAVLIAGKGHEDYQIVGAERRHFSDRDVALAALRRQP